MGTVMRARRLSSAIAIPKEYDMTHHTAAHRSQAMNACIDNCTPCHATCLETINYCLSLGGQHAAPAHTGLRSEEHTSALQSLMRRSYAVFCLKKTNLTQPEPHTHK